jgi:nucleoid-associated protein YgaU
MNVCGPTLGPSFEWRNAILSCAVFFSFLAIPTHGQDVAEAARQEKARKAAKQTQQQPQQTARHVYTDEDLKRKIILTPQDQARVEARKQEESPVPAEQDAEQLPSNADPQAESLGEVAQRFRRQQAVREAELADKKKFTPFPYQVPADSLAEPKAGFDPSVSLESILPASVQPAPPFRRYTVRSSVPAARGRVSPFQPRPQTGIPSVPPVALLALPGFSSSAPEPPAVVEVEKVLTVVPVSAGMRQVEVQRGQCWWKLAELYLGDGARWPELRKLNSIAAGSPAYLKLGSKVRTNPEPGPSP